MVNYFRRISIFIFILLLSSICIKAADTQAKSQKQSQSISTISGLITGKVGSVYPFTINKLKIPIDYVGKIAAVNAGSLSSGTFDGITFLFAGGFMLSGISDTGQAGSTGKQLWANAVAPASRVADYIPGPVSFPEHREAQIYVISRTDIPFGNSWQDWRDAVALGADFYDGDNDGIYNPVDKNGNGKWDANEDMPDLLGDLTAWCVYHDGMQSANRRWFEIGPQGIEIQQTMWGYNMGGAYGNVLFLRYRIISRGTIKNSGNMDSVYFSVWADPDLGDYKDDLIGCDTLINSGYVYNNGPDAEFGSNPPAFLMRFLQGPIAYIPGVTFIDNNSNGVYDAGIDVAIDTARVVRGSYKGIDKYPGARNQRLSSITNYVQSDPNRGDPALASEARNYMLGRLKNGIILNPCSDIYGYVYNRNCSFINPQYWYSGDPITQDGWIYTTPGDVRLMENTGPFKLLKDQPIDIVVGYVVGRGNDAKNSITVAKNTSTIAQDFFNKNFAVPSVTVNTRGLEGRSELKILCDGKLVNATSITAIIKTRNDDIISTLSLFDDGVLDDGIAGNKIFGNITYVNIYKEALVMDLSVTSEGGSVNLWPRIGNNITTTSLPITSSSISFDNLNNDGKVNPGEIIRYVFTINNPNQFSFSNLQINALPEYDKNILNISELAMNSSFSFIYNSANPKSYLSFIVPSNYTEQTFPVVITVTDDGDNIWHETLLFDVKPFEQKYSILQSIGFVNGKFSILITDPSAIKNHLYVIRGIDSIDANRTPGFMLKDSTDGRIILNNQPLPDYIGSNSLPAEGFKIFRGNMYYDLHGWKWDYSPSKSAAWFKINPDYFYPYSLSCGAYLAPNFKGVQYGFYGGGSTILRSKFDSVQIKFSQKTGFTDQNSNGKYDVGEPYFIDTTNLKYCQKAFFYSTNAFGTQVLYSGFKWIPFTAYNTRTDKQLNVVVFDIDRNGQWDVDGITSPRTNIAWIMETEYDPTGAAYDSTKGGTSLRTHIQYGLDMPAMWVLWMQSNGAEPYTQGELTLVPTYPISARNGFTFNPTLIVSVKEENSRPIQFSLEQNFPNPFNPTTTIRYTLSKRTLIKLKVFNLLGQEVKTLENSVKDAGSYSIDFNGSGFASGVYFYRIQADDFIQTKKLVLIK